MLILISINKISAQHCVSDEPIIINGFDVKQPCCNELISTDPFLPINNERQDYINGFNWMFNGNLPAYHPAGGIGSSPGITFPMENPFLTFSNNPQLQHINYYNFSSAKPRVPANIDFHPEDGWELLHRHFGFEMDNNTLIEQTTDNRLGPYFILYNRYTGIIRVLASLNQDPQQSVVTKLSFGQNSLNSTQPIYSGLLNHFGSVSQSLDQPSKVSMVTKTSQFPAGIAWFVSDFETAYDPCICNTETKLQLDFKFLNTADIKLSGRFVGTNVPLNGSAISPLLNSKEYLWSVYQDGFDVKGGMQTYNNIDALVNKYKSPPSLGTIEKFGIDMFKKIVKEGAKASDKWLDSKISPYVNSYLVSNFGLDRKMDEKLGLGLTAAGANYLMSQIFPTPPPIPNISFMEGEIAMSGTLESITSVPNSQIQLNHPGSKNSANTARWQEYPFYNEALGVFALFEQPKIKILKTKRDDEVFNPILSLTVTSRTRDYYLKLEPLKYSFNPTAEIDIEKTQISVALVKNLNTIAISSSLNFPNHTSDGKHIDDFHFIPTVNNNNTFLEYITDFIPLKCSENMYFKLENINTGISILESGIDEIDKFDFADSTKLRLIINYVSKPNRYNKVNRWVQIITYDLKTEVIDVESKPQDADYVSEYPSYLEIESTTYNSNPNIKAWNTIYVKGNLNTTPGTYANIKAGEEIIIEPEVVIDPEITLEVGLPMACGDNKLTPLSESIIKQFCSSTNYKANASLSKYAPNYFHQNDKNSIFNFAISLYPNPTNEITQLKYNLPINNQVSISIFDVSGNQIIKIAENKFQESGKHIESINTQSLSSGIYFCTLSTSDGYSETKKLIIAK